MTSLSQNGEYIPKDFITEQQKVFEFSNLLFILKKDQPNYYFYLGSNTTPPCLGINWNQIDNVYHLVINTPLKISTCQFKLLRSCSLITNTPKAIHSRLDKPSKKRKVYVISNKNLRFIPSIENDIPQEFHDLAEDINDEPLLPKKLSTISILKAIKKTSKLVEKGGRLSKKLKYNKKGIKIIRKGLNIKKIAISKYGKGILSGKRKKTTSSKRTVKNVIEIGVNSGDYGIHIHDDEKELNC